MDHPTLKTEEIAAENSEEKNYIEKYIQIKAVFYNMICHGITVFTVFFYQDFVNVKTSFKNIKNINPKMCVAVGQIIIIIMNNNIVIIIIIIKLNLSDTNLLTMKF